MAEQPVWWCGWQDKARPLEYGECSCAVKWRQEFGCGQRRLVSPSALLIEDGYDAAIERMVACDVAANGRASYEALLRAAVGGA